MSVGAQAAFLHYALVGNTPKFRDALLGLATHIQESPAAKEMFAGSGYTAVSDVAAEGMLLSADFSLEKPGTTFSSDLWEKGTLRERTPNRLLSTESGLTGYNPRPGIYSLTRGDHYEHYMRDRLLFRSEPVSKIGEGVVGEYVDALAKARPRMWTGMKLALLSDFVIGYGQKSLLYPQSPTSRSAPWNADLVRSAVGDGVWRGVAELLTPTLRGWVSPSVPKTLRPLNEPNPRQGLEPGQDA